MTATELQLILDKHALYLAGKPGGGRANLSGANLTEANLYGANLTEANLSRANLSGADLSWANLSGADLTGANLYRTNLSWANLSRADLTEVNLSGANLIIFKYNRHLACYTGTNRIFIGCKALTIAEWLLQLHIIGAKEEYTLEEIEAYKAFIELCEKRYKSLKS